MGKTGEMIVQGRGRRGNSKKLAGGVKLPRQVTISRQFSESGYYKAVESIRGFIAVERLVNGESNEWSSIVPFALSGVDYEIVYELPGELYNDGLGYTSDRPCCEEYLVRIR